jgi:hypothetical protein
MGLFDNFFTGADDNKAFNDFKALTGDIISAAGPGMKPWLTNPGYTPAPLNPWQTAAGEGAADLMGRGSIGSEVTLGDIYDFANPLIDTMNEHGQEQLGQSYERSANEIAGDLAAGNAFSGSGSAGVLAKHLLDESMLEASKDMAGANETAGLQFGASMAGGNEDRRLAGLNFDASMLGVMGAFGDQRQAYEQALLDKDYTTAGRLFGMLQGNVPEQEASGFQTLLGMILGNAKNVATAGKDFGWWGG